MALIAGIAAVLLALASVGYELSNGSSPATPSASRTPGGRETSTTPSSSPTTRNSGTGSSSALAALAAKASSGIVRVAATTCRGTGEGTGFLVAPTLVVTDAHVVDGAVALGLTSDGATRTGQVIGVDDSADVALIRTTSSLPGHVLMLAHREPGIGVQVGLVGYGSDTTLRTVAGVIRRVGQAISEAGQSRQGLMRTDAAVSPGDAGGPVLATDGSVVGMVDTGLGAGTVGYVVPATKAASLVARWEKNPAPPSAPSCATPLGPSTAGVIENAASGSDATGITATLSAYFNAIDRADYAKAYSELGPQSQAAVSEGSLASEDATTYDYNIVLQSVTTTGTGTDLADVAFTSLQRSSLGPGGSTCDNWTLQYTMVESNGSWLIDGATGQNGLTNEACAS